MTYIDYEEENYKNEAPDRWGHADLKNYWFQQLLKLKKTGSWRIKEATLLSKMMKEFTPEQIRDMIDKWVEKEPKKVNDFGMLYMERHDLREQITKEIEEWKWE